MDSAKLTLSEVLSIPTLPGNANKVDGVSEQKKVQAAKDFESVLIGKLLDEMNNSIGDWGFEESSASKQIQGTFCLFLARHLANNGGLGIWRDIYKSLPAPEQTDKNNGEKPQIDGII